MRRLGPRVPFRLAMLAALALSMAGAFHFGRSSPAPAHLDPMARVPRVVLWAWERREDLSFIDPKTTAIAYLDRTVELRGDAVTMRPRFEPLTIPRGTTLLPVARIENSRTSPPTLSHAQCDTAAALIAQMTAASPAAIQIDFDATASQRAFYRDLLAQVRRRIPRSTAISMTALASWCVDDNWLSDLDVDEIVPMLYRMGPDAVAIRAYIRRGGELAAGRAVVSVGVSLDEPISDAPRDKRVYLFSPRPWTPQQMHSAIAQAGR
jgi:hypothetical protein